MGIDVKDIRHVLGTCYVADRYRRMYDDYIEIPSYKEVCNDKNKICRSL